jgi:PRC-barrel domain
MRIGLTFIGLAISSLIPIHAATPVAAAAPNQTLIVAQAMVPPTGMEDEKKPMTAEQRMQARFPQPVRVGDLIGLPVLDDNSRTLGHVSEVVRTQEGKVVLIVAYGGLLGWGARAVAVPLEVVGIQSRELASLDMPPSEYAAAPTWHEAGAQALPDDATIKIALSRR